MGQSNSADYCMLQQCLCGLRNQNLASGTQPITDSENVSSDRDLVGRVMLIVHMWGGLYYHHQHSRQLRQGNILLVHITSAPENRTTMSVAGSVTGILASGSRSRPQARKKPNDDAAYFGPPSTGSKRQAVERAEGEPRVKRKRVEPSSGRKADKAGVGADPEDEKSSVSLLCDVQAARTCRLNGFVLQVDFKSLPAMTLLRYISHFNIVPVMYPSPFTSADPPAPSFLLEPMRYSSRALSPFAVTTPANRPRRDPKDTSRRRSSRLLEENETRTPIMADIAEVHTLLATVAERHFQDHVVNEIDTLASFMVKTKCD
jgi:hypothetical protein